MRLGRVQAGALAAAVLLSGPVQAQVRDWRAVATRGDRERLRGWRDAWMDALRGSDGTARDALFDPDRALAGPMPPEGAYRCRLVRPGGDAGAGERAWSSCRVEGAVFRLESGPQRPIGELFVDGPTRAILLGTMVMGDETRAMPYGRDATRDIAGIVERVGAARWRLVLPTPRFGAVLALVEVVPAQ